MNFAEDLIPVILESNDHWWDRDLNRLALVSPCWLYHVRRILYTSPSLDSFAACASLAQTLESNSYLASLVQDLTLRPTCTGALRSTTKDRMAVRTLLALDGLRSLTLGGELAIQSERFLGFVTAADTLERLHIDGTSLATSLTSRASLEWSEDMIFRFPNLQSLELTNLEMDICPSFTPRPLQMDEVILDSVSIVGGFLSHLVPEGSTVGKLCVAATSSCEYDEQIRAVLYSSNVRFLRYEILKAGPSDGAFLEPDEAEANPHTLSLHHLELHGFHIDVGVLNSLRQWCPEIKEFVVSGRLIALSPEDWAMFLTSGALPCLRRLLLTPGTNHPPYQHWNGDEVRPLIHAAALRYIDVPL